MKLSLADWKCTPAERKAVNDVLSHGWLTYGPVQRKLESMWAAYHGCKYGVVNSSGTAALQLAFRALKELNKWPSNSEVICPAITFPATINMVIESGLKPVLCDVNTADGMINVEKMEAAIGPTTRCVCVVHLWGTPHTNIDRIRKICRDKGLSLVEDSCETISRDVGYHGDISCFSMYFNHIVSAGVGGMACTNDKRLEGIMRSLANHGMIDTSVQPKYKRFNFCRVGYSFRITELEAAIAVEQFKRIDEILAARTSMRYYMTDEFIKQGVDEINLIGGTMMYPLILPAQDTPAEDYLYRDRVMFELDKRGVESRTALPITDQPVYKSIVGRNPDKLFPIAGIFNRRGIFLPIHPYMAKSHCVYAVKSLKDAIYAANLSTIKC